MDQTNTYLENEIKRLDNLITEHVSLLQKEENIELKAMLVEEIEQLKDQKKLLENSKDSFEYQKDDSETDSSGPIEINPNLVILEIRAGTGGDEAGLFALDLFKMYTRYAEVKGWKTETLFLSENIMGGIKTVTVEIKGLKVYELLKNESGVHRVQRIPITEAGGRIHTSTATVAILPQMKKVPIEIKSDDLKWEFFRAGGHGGQNVNKVSTAVRLIHLPTNTIIECQEERSQGKNRDKALSILESKLYQMMQEQHVKNISDLRANQIGTGERNEKIRTYNYPQSRITDHRIGKSWHNLEQIMNGNLETMLNDTKTQLQTAQG